MENFPLKSADHIMTTSVSLLHRVQQGQEQAWFEFYDRYTHMIRNIGKRNSLSDSECDDLMVDVMMVFWHRLHNFFYDPEKGKLRHYLSRIAYFVSMKRLRKNTLPDQNSALPEFPAEVDSTMMEEWKNFIMDAALAELKATVDSEIWQVFDMSFLQQRSVEDICTITRRKRGSVYAIRSRCLKKLRAIITCYRTLDEAELCRRSSRNAVEKTEA